MNNLKSAIASILCLSILLSAGCTNAAVSSGDTTSSAAEATTEPSSLSTEPMSDSSSYSEKLFAGDILKIEITATADDWQSLMDNATDKPWISADIAINGDTFQNVGIKTKGNTSLTQIAATDSDRYSLKVKFDKYVDGQSCYGLDKLVLNNIYQDATYLKEYMSYNLFAFMDVAAPLETFADIWVNGEHYGFYIALEDVDSSFLERNYGEDNTVTAYKPESMEMNGVNKNGGMDFPANIDGNAAPAAPPDAPADAGGNAQTPPEVDTVGSATPSADGGFTPPDGFTLPDGAELPDNIKDFGEKGGMNGSGGGVDLVYSDDEISSYSNIFDNNITKTDESDQQRLIATLKAISEGENLEDYINVDEVLRYAACNVFLVNMDSYFSNMGHNYILAEDSGVISMLPWDYNLSFGTFQYTNSSDVINYAIDTVFSGTTADQRPVIGKLLENEEYLAKYHEYLRQIAEEYVSSGLFEQTVNSVYATIDEYVKNDTTSFEGYDAFTAGVPVLASFMELRAQSVLGQLDGTIPSTDDGQSGSDALVDASELDLSLLGNMGGGNAGDIGFGGNRGDKNGFGGFGQRTDTPAAGAEAAPTATASANT